MYVCVFLKLDEHVSNSDMCLKLHHPYLALKQHSVGSGQCNRLHRIG